MRAWKAILDQLKRTDLQGSASRTERDLGSGVNLSNIGAGGKATTRVPIGDHQLDLGLGGFFDQGTVAFPREMQQRGAPPKETFINKGVNNLGLGVSNPTGQRIGVEFNPLLEQIMLRFSTNL